MADNLSEINPQYNNITILDDLMAEATDSPVVARLFTQGRHRNASVVLLLQNMFPKGKFNTDISRNAQYLVLFRCPSDRKQIGIVGERMFDKNRVHFMNALLKCARIPRPFSSILVVGVYYPPGQSGEAEKNMLIFLTNSIDSVLRDRQE